MIDQRAALILVDLQYDFLPGGALAVPDGDQVLPIARLLMQRKGAQFDLVVATQDWHPADHESFASQHPGRKIGEQINLHGQSQILWPDHCVQGTRGADLADGLSLSSGVDFIAQKGQDRAVDSYSGFFDNGRRRETQLNAFLRSKMVGSISVIGLATDYCVKFTALDARSLGFDVTLIESGVRGVELAVGDSRRAIHEMRTAGVRILQAI